MTGLPCTKIHFLKLFILPLVFLDSGEKVRGFPKNWIFSK
jgi:hypothetical protein